MLRRLEHLPELAAKARDANRRLVDTQRVGQGCLLASPAFERVAHPTLEEGRRAPALRFGDPRVMALAGALCTSLLAVTGITNRSLRARVAGLLGADYSIAQMSYDLRRLRMKGVIARLPGTNTYTLTPDGMRIAVFYTKLHDRLLRPLTAANDLPAPLPPASSPPHHRHLHRRLHRTVTHGCVKTWLKIQEPCNRGSLAAIGSHDAAVALLDGLKLTAPGMKQLAQALGASIAGASTKSAVRDRIIEHTVGFRLNSQTIRAGSWSS